MLGYNNGQYGYVEIKSVAPPNCNVSLNESTIILHIISEHIFVAAALSTYLTLNPI